MTLFNNLNDNLPQPFTKLADEGKDLKPLRSLFGHFIYEGGLIHFPSERGVGKTMLNIQLCYAISSEWKKFCGEKIELHGNSLLLNFELHEDNIRRRLAQMVQNPPMKIKQDKYQAYIYTSRSGFVNEIEKINKFINEFQPVIIFLDNYRTAFLGSDSNSNKDATIAINEMLRFKDKFNPAIVITDHTRKHTRGQMTDSDLQSGAGAKSDLVDSDMFLRKSSQNENYRILKRSNSRYWSEQSNAKLLRLSPETLWFEMVSEEVNEEEHIGEKSSRFPNVEKREIAETMRNKGKTVECIANKLNVSKSTIRRWLNS